MAPSPLYGSLPGVEYVIRIRSIGRSIRLTDAGAQFNQLMCIAKNRRGTIDLVGLDRPAYVGIIYLAFDTSTARLGEGHSPREKGDSPREKKTPCLCGTRTATLQWQTPIG